MGMKFHKLYVAVLNPLGIILIGIIAVLLLLVALHPDAAVETPTGEVTLAEEVTEAVTEEAADNGVDIPIVGDFEKGAILWALFGASAAVFLFALITEFLLVARKKSGIVLLSISLLLGLASNITSYARYTEQTPWYTMLITVVISVLVLLYYWRRYKAFT